MSLGLKKYENEINQAWRSVVDEKNENDWALFGYDGQSNDLKVVSTGKYGLDELQQEFNPGKVLYAFVKVLNPKSNLPCFITISMVGEGAPLNRKSSSPKHSIEIQKLFRYSSLNIHAREEEEVEPENILEKIRKSSTTEFNFSIKSEIEDKPSPVSTNFVRVRPEKDLNLKEKTNFWSKLEKEENEKKQQEIRKQKELKLNEHNLIGNKLSVQNNPLKISLNKKTTNDEQVIKKKSDKLSNEIISKREQFSFWAEQEAEERRQREEENRKRFLQDKRAIENEVKNSENNAKQIVNTFNNQTNTNSTVKKINAIDEINLEKKKVLSSIKNSLNNDKENTEVNIQDEELLPDDELNDEIVIHEDDESLTETDINNRTFTKSEVNPSNPNEYYKLQAEFCNSSKQQQQQYLIEQRINEEDEIYDEEEYENEYCLDNGLTNYTSYLSKRLSNEPLEDIQEEDENIQDDELLEYIQGKGLCARALYDYQASDETEISFDPQDIISHIEKTFDSWYTGQTKDGKRGLFPSNYVELIEFE